MNVDRLKYLAREVLPYLDPADIAMKIEALIATAE